MLGGRFHVGDLENARRDGSLSLSYYKAAAVSNRLSGEIAGKYRLAVDLVVNEKVVDGVFDSNKCRFIFKVDGKEALCNDYSCRSDKPYHYEIDQYWKAGDHALAFEMHPLKPKAAQTRTLTMQIKSVTVRGPMDTKYWARPKNYERFFPKDVPSGVGERREYARQILGDFARKAFRRPVDERTVNRLPAGPCGFEPLITRQRRNLKHFESMSRTLRNTWRSLRLIRAMTFFLGIVSVAAAVEDTATGLAPGAVVAGADGRRLFIACAAANRVLVLDTRRAMVTNVINVPASPSGLALSSDGGRLYVTCAAPESTVAVFDTASGRLQNKLNAGHTAMAPLLSPSDRTLYVCNRFDNNVSVIGLPSGQEIARIAVSREPVAAALTPDGRWLLVANHLQTGRADVTNVAAAVSVIDTTANRVAKTIVLPNGSGLLRGIAVSPDGRVAAVTHVLSHNNLPTTQLDRGWMNCNALTLLDLSRMERLGTVLLDEVDRGAANPWAVAWSPDGGRLLVTHAGTRELSVIEAPALLAKLAGTTTAEESADDLAFLVGIRRRVALPLNGPRALAVSGTRAFVAGYFSDNLVAVDLTAPTPSITAIPLSTPRPLSSVQRGEMLFNDAGLCFQGWQSCASCHSSDGRVDGENWDLLNDGIGNPKNTHSLLLSDRTPPVMSEGERATAKDAVRAGIQHIQFSVQPEEVVDALDDYLKSLKPVPSPYLINGCLSASAQRGKRLFEDPRIGCAVCHPPGLFTSLQSYNVGTRSVCDDTAIFTTPSLIELWRTAPYLHDGSAATVNDVLTTRNAHDQHGRTSHLMPAQLADLANYLLSL